MNSLFTALLPWPYRVLAYALVALALVTTGYVKGRSDANAAVVQDKFDVLTKTVVRVQKINASDKQTQAAYNKGKAAAESDYQSAIERAADNAQAIPDVPSCALDSRRVFNINSALGYSHLPRTGDPAGGVSGPTPLEGR